MLVFDGVRMGATIELNGKFLGNASNQFQRYVFNLDADDLVQQPSSHADHGKAPGAPTNTLKVTFGAELGIPLGGRYATCAHTCGWCNDWNHKGLAGAGILAAAKYSVMFDPLHPPLLELDLQSIFQIYADVRAHFDDAH